MGQLKRDRPLVRGWLRLFPAEYRRRYGDETLQTLADMLNEAGTPAARRSVWVRVTRDLVTFLPREYAKQLGDIMTNETPTYVQRAQLISLILLAPFVVIVLINSWANHALDNGWLWHVPVLATWLIVMPGLAVVLALGALVAWIGHDHQGGVWRSLFHRRQTWLLLAISLFGLGILALVFGHDSVHCVIQSPVQTWQHWSETWRCIRQR